MPRWWKIPSWKRLTKRFRCWMRLQAARSGWSAASKEHGPRHPRTSFDEIDFGSYFQEYLDPGYRTQPEYEESEKPSFENFLSQPTTLSDHLAWQLGALSLDAKLHEAAEFVVGNLDEDGYLAASEEELAAAFGGFPADAAASNGHAAEHAAALELIRQAIDLVQHLDPAGVGARDLRECLLIQIAAQQQEFSHLYGSGTEETEEGPAADPHRGFRAEAEARIDERRRAMEVAALIVDRHLPLLAEARREGPGARGAGDAGRGARGGGVYPHARPAAGAAVQPRADAADRARCVLCEARRRVGGHHERRGPAQPAAEPALPAHAGLERTPTRK